MDREFKCFLITLLVIVFSLLAVGMYESSLYRQHQMEKLNKLLKVIKESR